MLFLQRDGWEYSRSGPAAPAVSSANSGLTRPPKLLPVPQSWRGGDVCELLSEQVSQVEGPSLQPSSPFPPVRVLLITQDHGALFHLWITPGYTWFSEDNQIIPN